jgi:nitroreductase
MTAAMEFAEAVRRRRMVRRFDPDRPVARPVIAGILDLATRAPSAGFSQGWHFLVLDDPASRSRFWAATAFDRPEDAWLAGMRTAAALIVPLADRSAYLTRYAKPDKTRSSSATPTDTSASSSSARPADPDSDTQWPVPYWDLDTAMASVIALLAATDLGLGSCFFGIPASGSAPLRAEFAMPADLSPIGVIAIGYEAGYLSGRPRRARRPASETTSWGHFGASDTGAIEIGATDIRATDTPGSRPTDSIEAVE